MAIKSLYDKSFDLKGWWGSPLDLETWFDSQWVKQAAGGQTIAVGQAVEVSVAQAIAWAPKRRLVNQVVEVSIAQAITRRKVKTVAQVIETSVAQVVTSRKLKAVGITTEISIAQAITKQKVRAVAQVVEVEVVQAVTSRKVKAVGQVVEIGIAQAVSWAPKYRLVGQVIEIETAFTITRGGAAVQVGQVVEVSVAQPLTARKLKTLGIVLETEVVQGLLRSKTKTVDQVVETSIARGIAWAPKHRLAGQAVEIESVFPITNGFIVGPAPAGTVPIRYILSGDTANIVPVETVLVWDFGVVRVREFVGPANVVPVRETNTETPRVKVMKV